MSEPPGYEAARAELADIVRALEAGGQPLEESLALWQRGEELADLCQQWLDGATRALDAAIAAHDAHADADTDTDADADADADAESDSHQEARP